MAVISTKNIRLGKGIPGTAVSMRKQEGLPSPTGEQDGGPPGLKDEKDDKGGSLSGSAAVMRANELKRQFDIEQEAARTALQRQQAGTLSQARYLQSELGVGVPETIRTTLQNLEQTGTENIGLQYNALLNELAKRRQQGLQQIGAGYGTLATYLQQNAPQAFAQAQRVQPETVQSALGQYMAGQGVSPAVAQEAAQIANLQAAGGAANFNQLLDVLAAREAAAQQSRLAEAEMGRAAGVTGLESIYGAGTAQLEQAKLSAINELAARIGQARLQAQEQATSRQQSLQDALAALIGTGLVTQEQISNVTPTQTAVQAPAQTPAQQLAAKLPGIKKESLRNDVVNFIANNPNATAAQVQKKFKSLGKNIS